jgi:lipopolysaccharide export system permease protein
VSIYRIIMRFIGAGVIGTLLVGVINEVVAPNAAYRAEQFLAYHQTGRAEKVYFARHVALKNDQNIWYIKRIDTRDSSMYNVELVEQREDGSDALKIQAKKALWLDGQWWFMDLTVQNYNENGDLKGAPKMELQREMRDLHETPETFMTEIKDPAFLSSREMLHYLESKKGISSATRARLKVDLHSRIAAPLICLIVTIIGVPVGAHTGRRGAFAGIMMAMSLFFGFYILQLVCQGLGKEGLIPAWLGGWLPTLLFGAASPFMIHRLR